MKLFTFLAALAFSSVSIASEVESPSVDFGFPWCKFCDIDTFYKPMPESVKTEKAMLWRD